MSENAGDLFALESDVSVVRVVLSVRTYLLLGLLALVITFGVVGRCICRHIGFFLALALFLKLLHPLAVVLLATSALLCCGHFLKLLKSRVAIHSGFELLAVHDLVLY